MESFGFCRGGGDCLFTAAGIFEKNRRICGSRKKIPHGEIAKSRLQVILSDANFILFYSEKPLYEKLLQKGILIRDCKNFQGLSEGYYRVAVKSRRENEILEKAIGECIG